jgi:hypothetical protein
MLPLVTVEGAVVALGAGAGLVAVSGADCAKAGIAIADASRAPMMVVRMDFPPRKVVMPCNVFQGIFVPSKPSQADGFVVRVF